MQKNDDKLPKSLPIIEINGRLATHVTGTETAKKSSDLFPLFCALEIGKRQVDTDYLLIKDLISNGMLLGFSLNRRML
jgi:hypothetical protein